jgi:hypothetical protein
MFGSATIDIVNQKKGYTDHPETNMDQRPNTRRLFLIVIRTSKEYSIRHNNRLHLQKTGAYRREVFLGKMRRGGIGRLTIKMPHILLVIASFSISESCGLETIQIFVQTSAMAEQLDIYRLNGLLCPSLLRYLLQRGS